MPCGRYVCVLGVYGKGNLGDEALVQVIAEAVGEAHGGVGVVVFGSDPAEVQRRLSLRAVSRAPFPGFRAKLDLVRRSEAIILGGGTLLCDHGGFIKNLRAIGSAFFWPALGRLWGVPTISYAQGLGPAREWPVRWAIRHLLGRVAAITLRDRRSGELMQAVRRLPGEERRVSCDPVVGASLFQPETIAGTISGELRARIDALRPYCVVSLRTPTDRPHNPEHYYRAWAEALARFHAMDPVHFLLFPALLSASRPDDRIGLRIVEEVLTQRGVPRADVTLAVYDDVSEGVAWLQHATLAAGDRLHALLFAAMAGVPVLGVDIEDKIPGCLEMIQTGRYCSVFHPNEVGSERFVRALREARGAVEGDRILLRESVRRWASRDDRNRVLLSSVLRETSR